MRQHLVCESSSARAKLVTQLTELPPPYFLQTLFSEGIPYFSIDTFFQQRILSFSRGHFPSTEDTFLQQRTLSFNRGHFPSAEDTLSIIMILIALRRTCTHVSQLLEEQLLEERVHVSHSCWKNGYTCLTAVGRTGTRVSQLLEERVHVSHICWKNGYTCLTSVERTGTRVSHLLKERVHVSHSCWKNGHNCASLRHDSRAMWRLSANRNYAFFCRCLNGCPMASLVLTDSSQLTVDSFKKLPDQITYPYTELDDLQKHVFSISTAVSILSILLISCHAQHNEAFFNRTSYVRLQTPISLHSHTGLSFRTCHGGDLFVQHINTSKISLEVRSDGLVFMADLGGRRYESRLNERLLDNSWHYVNLLYRLGNLTLSVAGHQQVIANATFNSEILEADLAGPDSILIVGKNFYGCILEGPSIVFNTSGVTHQDVLWGPCPLPNTVCSKTDHCYHDPCSRHGTCISRPERYECDCTARYSGTNCEIDNGSPCNRNGMNPCLNNGRCDETEVGDYTCTCDSEHTGVHCETELGSRLCENNPCQNNGTCLVSLMGDRYECECVQGFSGNDCEININECLSNPCQHGGTCVDGINSYSCLCGRTGYTGRNCEININECENNPCLNQGVCFDNYGSYTCQCSSGFGGQNCELLSNALVVLSSTAEDGEIEVRISVG
uniref:Uncharacterized protein n=1 Tax=Timema poppense TaxID=170557 RepID=A0A7R9D668_TIMPO|nr:unnamed protein product [Timema poppensis]